MYFLPYHHKKSPNENAYAGDMRTPVHPCPTESYFTVWASEIGSLCSHQRELEVIVIGPKYGQ